MKSLSNLLRSFGNTHDAVYAVDALQRIIYWNAGAERLFGYSEHEVLKKLCWRVIGGRRGQRPWCGPDCRVQRCLARGSFPPHCYFETHTREGRAIWVSINIIRLEERGKPVAVHVLTNVTRQERMRAALVGIQSTLKAHGMIPSAGGPDGATPGRTSGGRQIEETLGLTRREVEILKLMGEGLSSQVIATRLVISHFTVRNHIQNLLCKLSVHSRAQAVSVGFTRGLL